VAVTYIEEELIFKDFANSDTRLFVIAAPAKEDVC
jgi:hypothetical protein